MSQIDFNNTEIAFAHKSNADLKKAKLLFNTFNYPLIIKYGPKLANLFIDFIPPVKTLIKKTLFAQFCGGENIEDCNASINRLNQANIGTILDYSVEGEETELVFDQTTQEVIDTIVKASQNRESIPFSVFKTTGIGAMDILTKVNAKTVLTKTEQDDFERIKNRFETICKKAFDLNVKIFVDAEDSWIQDVIDELCYEMMEKFNQKEAIVFNTIQCYRTGRVNHILNQINNSKHYLGFKLVRGAYMEKERLRAEEKGYNSPIHIDKISTDNEYNQALKVCVEHLDKVSICAGTHNEESTKYLSELMLENNISKQHKNIFFAQLLGMSDHISYNMSNAGYNVAKYVPYGPVKAVLPYLSRRAEENSSVKGQVGRELKLIQKELNRRNIK